MDAMLDELIANERKPVDNIPSFANTNAFEMIEIFVFFSMFGPSEKHLQLIIVRIFTFPV